MNACSKFLWGCLKDTLRTVGFIIIFALVFFVGVKAHVHGQRILDTMSPFEIVEPLPEKASAPAVSLTTVPFKGVL